MANATGSITINTVGTNKSFTGLGFTPTKLKFTVGAANGASATYTLSEGAVDSAGNQWVVSAYDDFGGNHTNNTSQSNCVWVQVHNGGGWTDDVKASFNSFISGGFKLDVTAANPSFQVFFEASN